MSREKRLWLLMTFVIITLALGLIILIFTSQRLVILDELGHQSDETLDSFYVLSNNTYKMLYTADDIEAMQKKWEESFENTYNTLETLSLNPSLKYLPSSINKLIKKNREVWEINKVSFWSGNKMLSIFLKTGYPVSLKSNIYTMLKKVDTKGLDEIDKRVLSLRQAYIELNTANKYSDTFITATLLTLNKKINDDIRSLRKTTLIVSITIMLAVFIMLGLGVFSSIKLVNKRESELEKMVEQRTKEIQSLLDFSGTGFLSFGSDLIVRDELSRECKFIFGYDITGKNFSEVLFETPNKQSDFVDAMELVFSGGSAADVVFDVLQKTVNINDKIIEVGFKQIDESIVLCQLSDITERERLRLAIEKDTEEKEMLLKAVISKRYFLGIIEEAEELFTYIRSFIFRGTYTAAMEENEEIVRMVHTFKSNAAFLRMKKTVKSAHILESSLLEYGILSEGEIPLGSELKDLITAFNNEMNSVTDVLGKDWNKASAAIELEPDAVNKAIAYVKRYYPDDKKLAYYLDSFFYQKLSMIFERTKELIDYLAASNGKRISVHTDPVNVALSPDVFTVVSDALNHIARNMVVHGIELPNHREKAGKNSYGKISITSSIDEKGIVNINITDDGEGLSLEKIRLKAVELGKLAPDSNPSKSELIKMIFEPGFSTSESVTAIAGRGYGLSAVKESIYRIGGKISINSSKGHGTKFGISIPNRRRII